jgi:hypothetical protein
MESNISTDKRMRTIDQTEFFVARHKKQRASLSLKDHKGSDLPYIYGPKSTVDKNMEFRFQSQLSQDGSENKLNSQPRLFKNESPDSLSRFQNLIQGPVAKVKSKKFIDFWGHHQKRKRQPTRNSFEIGSLINSIEAN